MRVEMKVRNHKTKKKSSICLRYTSISIALAEQIEVIVKRRLKAYPKDTSAYLQPLLDILPRVITRLSEVDRNRFLQIGFEAFSELGYRLRFEHAYYQEFVTDNYPLGNKNPLRLIRKVIGLYFDDEINYPLSDVVFDDESTLSIHQINALPVSVVPDVRLIMFKVSELIIDKCKRNEITTNSGKQVLLSFLSFFNNVISKCPPIVQRLEDQLTIHEVLTEKEYLDPLFILAKNNVPTTHIKKNGGFINHVVDCLTYYAPKSELRFMIGKAPLDSTKRQSLIEIVEYPEFHRLPEAVREHLIDIFTLRLDPIKFKRSETLRRIKYFSSLFQLTTRALTPEDRKNISTKGLDEFRCPNFTNRFEHAIYNAHTTVDESEREFSNGILPFRYLIAAYFKDNDFPIYDVKLSGGTKFSFADLNALPLELAIEAKEIAHKITKNLEKKQNRTERTISTILFQYMDFMKNHIVKNKIVTEASASGASLSEILTQERWFSPIFKKIYDSFADEKKANETVLTFKRALHEYAPDTFIIKSIKFSNAQMNRMMKDEYPVLNKQLDEFINLFEHPIKAHKTKRIHIFSHFLLAHINKFDAEFHKQIKEIGIKVFITNEGVAWLQLRDIERKTIKGTLDKDRKTASPQRVIGWVLTKMLGCQISIAKYDPYFIEVESTTNDGVPAYRSVHSLKNYPAIIEDLREIANIEAKRIDGEMLANTTVSSYITGIIKVFTEYFPVLTIHEQQLLSTLGAKAFIANNSAIIKKIRQSIQSDFIAKKIQPMSGTKKQSDLDKYLKHFGLPLIPSYPIATGKRSKHAAKEAEKQPLYSTNEIIELAYTIEFSLRFVELTYSQKLSLNIARIILKTAWNIAPILRLETTDIFNIDYPLSKKSVPCVRLFKKRAGYQTQWHKLNLSIEDLKKEGVVINAEARSVFLNITDIRDKLTAKQRNKMPNDHPLKQRIFTTYSNNNMDWIAMGGSSVTNIINEVLEKQGCSVRFVARRIRKTGLNDIYKKVRLNFKKYQKTGLHSFDVFIKHYLEKNSAENKANLLNALEVMGDYFNDRKLTDDIIILTDTPDESRQTPNGSCMSKGQDEASYSFNKKHHRLSKINGTDETPCADFNACLFCEHYRLIADWEHVWRLLSYRDYVLAQMRNSIGIFDDSSKQQIFTQTLELRVEQILEKIRRIDPTAIDDGKVYLKEYGVHPDWEMVA
jgi:hypothetical protein